MQIQHIFFSDNKFMDSSIEQFENVYPGNNKYLVLLKNNKFKFDKSYYKHLEKCEFMGEDFQQVSDVINASDVVIIHRFSNFLKSVVGQISQRRTKIIWFCWGGDIYGENCFFDQEFIFGDATKEIYKKYYNKRNFSVWRSIAKILNSHLTAKLNNVVNSVIKKILKKEMGSNQIYKAVERVDYLACVIPPEFQLITHKTNLRAKEFHYSYSNLKLLCGDYYGKDASLGNKILLGNAATYSNNHADMFSVVQGRKVSNELIVPLSYGDDKYYKKEINELGDSIFGSQFQSLMDFLPRDEYSDILSSCGFMVMYNKRQEAVGNIVLGLYMGMKVFLNEENVVYQFLKDAGMYVFSFQKDFKPQALLPLNKSIIDENRSVLEGIWGEKATQLKLAKSVEMVINDQVENRHKS